MLTPCETILQRVDVEAGVGLVEDRELGLEHRHLQDLEALLLAAREAVVEVAAGERLVDLQHLQRGAELVAELLRGDRVVGAVGPALAVRVDGLPEEARDGHAGHGVGVLEGQEHAEARALVGLELQQIDALERHAACRDLVGRMPHEDVGERRLARAVRAHDGVHLALGDFEVDALQDLLAVDLGAETFDDEVSHVRAFPESGPPRAARERMKRCNEGAPNSVQRSASDLSKTALSLCSRLHYSIHRPFQCEDGNRSAKRRLAFSGYGALSSLVYPSRVGLLKGAPVFGSIGPQEILIVLVIALVVLGPKKLPEMARSLGKGVKEFKEGINDDDTVDVTADEEEEEEPVSSRVHELPPADLPPAAEAPEPVAAPEPAVAPAGADKPAADAS